MVYPTVVNCYMYNQKITTINESSRRSPIEASILHIGVRWFVTSTFEKVYVYNMNHCLFIYII